MYQRIASWNFRHSDGKKRKWPHQIFVRRKIKSTLCTNGYFTGNTDLNRCRLIESCSITSQTKFEVAPYFCSFFEKVPYLQLSVRINSADIELSRPSLIVSSFRLFYGHQPWWFCSLRAHLNLFWLVPNG